MLVFLTGGIGAGKSTVLSMFADLGAEVESADALAHRLLERADVQAEVQRAVGPVDVSDRSAIAAKVFGDSAALRRLEDVLHPLVREALAVRRTQLGSDGILVFEQPLPPQPQPGDVVISVEADPTVRLARLEDRGMTKAAAQARMRIQPDAATYAANAVYTIVNNGDPRELRAQVESVWKELSGDPRNF